ncbi:FAD-binding oxidoreductase [Teredinibacter turnerae]|uniref:FAD-binding oxidoreductase n=1 Tax=Teredinibacter turnerae TaxID=2426 RepID=UPI00049098D8|nr:FAD-dependent oxidoreductase [Teredinibacter turnerae]
MEVADTRVADFITEARNALGAEFVLEKALAQAFEQCVSGHSRRIAAVVQARDIPQIRIVLQLCKKFELGLYPISQGKNWGMGSRLPVQNGCVVLDLSGMSKIAHIDPVFGTITLEPGVTQQQVYEHLLQENLPFYMDVTGSSRESSVIGNLLERGVAYNTLRVDQLVQLEVMLADGSIVKTGFGEAPNSLVSHLYPHGLGPNLTGLFLQSNFGIVISATLTLLPKQESHFVFIANIRETRMVANVIDDLRLLLQQKILDCVVHVGNHKRREITLAPLVFEAAKKYGVTLTRGECEGLVNRTSRGDWSAVGVIAGNRHCVKAHKKIVQKTLGAYGKVGWLTAEKLRIAKNAMRLIGLKRQLIFLEAVTPLLGYALGKPSSEALRSAYWPFCNEQANWQNPDFPSDGGLIFCTPLLPMCSSAIEKFHQITQDFERTYLVKFAITLNTMNRSCIEAVISLEFDRQNADTVQRTKTIMTNLLEQCAAEGFLPYRLDIDSYRKFCNNHTELSRTSQRIKQLLDPDGIIAPGRYGLSAGPRDAS